MVLPNLDAPPLQLSHEPLRHRCVLSPRAGSPIGSKMTDWPHRPLFRDPRYPGGWAEVIAWDYVVEGTRETTTFLCRLSNGQHIVHQFILDGTFHEVLRVVSDDDVLVVYDLMTVHLLSDVEPNMFLGNVAPNPPSDREHTAHCGHHTRRRACPGLTVATTRSISPCFTKLDEVRAPGPCLVVARYGL